MRRFGLVALVLAVGIGGAAAQNVSEQYLLAAANQDRAANGLGGLKIDEHLSLAARLHAAEMANRKDISHQFDGEADLATRASDSGAHFSLITENVAEASNAAKIHELWMNSAGHRANLLDPQVDAVGIAVVQRGGQLYAVEDFGRTVTVLTIDQQEAKVGRLLTARGLRLDAENGDARQTCTMSKGFAGARQAWFVMRYSGSSLDTLPAELASRIATGKYREAEVGACVTAKGGPFTSFDVAVMLFP